ncbi:hypothetical protein M413DRAFT_14968, partial [Hebeloma cylindrosporum]
QHCVAQQRAKKLAGPKQKNKKLIESQEQEQIIVSERNEAAERSSETLGDSENRISNDKEKIEALEKQVNQLQDQIRKGQISGSTFVHSRPDHDVHKLNSRLEARDAEIERLRRLLAEKTTRLESQNSEDALLAVDSERAQLQTQIEKERRTVIRYRKERDEKRKEVAIAVAKLESIRRELENVRQDLESAEAREIELMVEVNRYRMQYKGKGKAKEFVHDADKEQELRKEIETLKIVHARAIIEKSNELAAMHQKCLRRSRRAGKQDTETQQQISSEKQSEPTPGSEPRSSSSMTTAGKASPQAAPSATTQNHTSLPEARRRRNVELERKRKQAEALAMIRRRR